MKKTTLALILCLVLCLPVFASCSRGGETTEASATEPVAEASGTEEATAGATTDKWEILAPKITMMAENARTLKIEYSIGKSAERRRATIST